MFSGGGVHKNLGKEACHLQTVVVFIGGKVPLLGEKSLKGRVKFQQRNDKGQSTQQRGKGDIDFRGRICKKRESNKRTREKGRHMTGFPQKLDKGGETHTF